MFGEISAALGRLKWGFGPLVASAGRDDRAGLPFDTAQAPDAHRLARFLAVGFGADGVINIRCALEGRSRLPKGTVATSARAPSRIEPERDCLDQPRWIGVELVSGCNLERNLATLKRPVVVCSGAAVRRIFTNPAFGGLAQLWRQAHAVIIALPLGTGACRMRPTGRGERQSCAPSPDAREYAESLRRFGMAPTFIGLASSGGHRRPKDTLLAVIDRCPLAHAQSIPSDFRPLAIVGTYNDADIAPQTISKLLCDGMDVHVLDNWSTDSTYDQLLHLKGSFPGLSIERFPLEGPSEYHEWHRMLSRKEEFAAQHPDRWIIHHDSDEIRCSPWEGVSLRGGLYIAEKMGFSAVDFTVCNFRPVDDRFAAGKDPEAELRCFEFGALSGHFLQVKAWRQGSQRVALADRAGHDVRFANRRVFPYKFILKHYPLRNSDQARRKVFRERMGRFAPHLRALGWHTQYDTWKPGAEFVWDPSELIEFKDDETRWEYLTELISGIGIGRGVKSPLLCGRFGPATAQ